MKITINMLSQADSIEGQGVGSAYLEQVALIKEMLPNDFEVRINSRKKADIMHVHTINLRYFFRFKKKNGIRVMYCHFLPETLDGSIKLPKIIFKMLKKYIISFYKKADYLVVVNPIFKKDLVRYGIKEDGIVYIPNYVKKETFHELDLNQKLDIRKKYNIDENKFIVLGCGQIQNRKGVLDFVEVAKSNPDKEFIWCGGFSFSKISDGYKKLKELTENPPTPNLHFLGIVPRNEINEVFNIADVFFMPSYNELFPMSILEACSVGKPLILRDLELYKDILFEKYLKGQNNDDFSRIINELKDNEELYNKALDDSKYISNYYSKENVSKIWKDFYSDIYNKKMEQKKK